MVTGASGVLGGEIARGLAGAGARVGLLARRREPLEELARSLGDSAVVLEAPKKRQRPSSTRRGPDEAGSGCAMVARSARWLRHYPWKHPRRNRQRRSLRYANRIYAASKGDTPRVSGVPIRRPRRPEHSWSRYRRTAQQLQSAAVHSRLTDRTPSSIDRRRARALSTPGDSWPASSTKRYAVAADTGERLRPVSPGP